MYFLWIAIIWLIRLGCGCAIIFGLRKDVKIVTWVNIVMVAALLIMLCAFVETSFLGEVPA